MKNFMMEKVESFEKAALTNKKDVQVLKDIVNRYKLLRGYRIHYVPGFDCHGTSVEDFYKADTS